MPRRYRIDEKVIESTPEKLRIEIDQIFRDFLQSDETAYCFSSDLNNFQRKYVHDKAKKLNLISKSYGKEPNRQLRVTKKTLLLNRQMFYMLLKPESIAILDGFGEHHDDPPNTSKRELKIADKNFGKLTVGLPPMVGSFVIPANFRGHRESLPTESKHVEIMNAINSYKVTIVSSETGSGKSTQIPQYIMEDCFNKRRPCRIVCAQPRRISAVSVAERVAEELGVGIGTTVGYHIRLESKLSSSSNIIYVTNGVLVRTVMCGPEALKCYTHIIIDEIHERDKLTDFLLICLRGQLASSDLKLILMSATMDVHKFSEYFDNEVGIIDVPGRLFPIQEYFLDDIFPQLKYLTPGMAAKKIDIIARSGYNAQAADLLPPQETNHDADYAINNVLQMNTLDNWSQLMMHLYQGEISFDYRHSQTGMTALMVAAAHGNCNFIFQLINMGANPNIRTPIGQSAYDFALLNGQDSALNIIDYYKDNDPAENSYDVSLHLKAYDMTTPEEMIDYALIVEVIMLIHRNYEDGAILIFLPGYDDIMQCNDRILESKLHRDKYRVFFLHGSMSIQDQYDVFREMPRSRRKIILATNIAETSLTISDVVYVIDSGKAKEKTYDSYSGMGSLQTQWISKACIKQRTGRAGRTRKGYCFHIYSKQRYDSFNDERTPEILRVPLEELCLHTKAIINNQTRIEEFLAQAPSPPSPNAIRVAVESLQALGALDEAEVLTPLGEYLGQLTIEPHLGKMLIYSLIFKCLDPIITLVASLTYKDPFQLPPQAHLKVKAAEKRKSLTQDVLSDHLIFMQVFQEWQNHLPDRQKEFCRTYFINGSTMEMILMTRMQLLGQLRGSGFLASSHSSLMEYNTYSNCWPLVKAAICCGLYPKIAFPIRNIIQTKSEKNVSISNNSCLFKMPIENCWLMYDEITKVRSSAQLRGVTAIAPITVPLLCGNECTLKAGDIYEIDGWLELETQNCNLVINFRKILASITKKVLANPTNKLTQLEVDALSCLTKILEVEEAATNLAQAYNFGNRPKYVEVPKFRKFRSFAHGGGGGGGGATSNPFMDVLTVNQFSDSLEEGMKMVNLNGEASAYWNGGNTPGTSKNYYNYGYDRRGLNGSSHYGYPRYQNHRNRGNYHNVKNSSYSQPGPSSNVPFNNGLPLAVSEPNQYDLYPPEVDLEGKFVVIKAKTVQNVLTAYTNERWVCAANTEKFLTKSNFRKGSIYLVFYIVERDSLGGIARLCDYEVFQEGRRNLAVLSWIFKKMVPVADFPLLKKWMSALKFAKLGQMDGLCLEREIFSEVYSNFSRSETKSN